VTFLGYKSQTNVCDFYSNGDPLKLPRVRFRRVSQFLNFKTCYQLISNHVFWAEVVKSSSATGSKATKQ
jgi:hypothetical protein